MVFTRTDLSTWKSFRSSWLAQLVQHGIPDLRVLSSSPMLGMKSTLKKIFFKEKKKPFQISGGKTLLHCHVNSFFIMIFLSSLVLWVEILMSSLLCYTIMFFNNCSSYTRSLIFYYNGGKYFSWFIIFLLLFFTLRV